MIKFTLAICISISCFPALSQIIINGDFENNLADSCTYNLTNAEFNDTIPYVNSYGINEEADILTHGCNIIPQSGNWCVGISSAPSGGHDAITLELDSALNIGNSYEIKFWAYGNTTFTPVGDSVKVGLTSSDTSFGETLYTFSPTANTWKEHTIQFSADSNFSFISVEIKEDFHSGWVQIDNFTISSLPNGIIENNFVLEPIIYPNPMNGNFSIDLRENYKTVTTTITDLSGKIMQSKTFSEGQLLSLRLEEPAGVYLLTIDSGEKKTVIRLINE